jgi:hypothetical protein
MSNTPQWNVAVRATTLVVAPLLVLLAACGEVVDGADAGATQDGGFGTSEMDGGTIDQAQADAGTRGNAVDPGVDSGTEGSSSNQGGSGSTPPPATGEQICRNGGTCLEVTPDGVDKVDLLFMVDDSGSMREEQEALRVQFPALVRALTTGDLDGDGDAEAAAASSVHLGVVSSDLGLVGVEGIESCMGLGDDGVMQNLPSPEVSGCQSEYPRFLSYAASTDDPATVANDFACIATLGTTGCGFEQQLESALKAVWPSDDTRVTFLPDPMGFGALGQGGPGGMNAGFLRSDSIEGPSVIGIVIVTDEEDCSSKDTRHVRPPAFLDPNNPDDATLLQQGLNVRCAFNEQNLYTKERYINAFKALRPGKEPLVVFAAIAGVPPDAIANIPEDFATNDVARSAFYQQIYTHPQMQPTVDTKGTPSPDDDSMLPSCDTASGRAYPPRRIVEVAEGFGDNGIVRSICQEDFRPAIDAIAGRIATRLGAGCLPRPIVRDDDGLAGGCDVLWALPTPGAALAGTPTECSELPFLSPAGEDATSAQGGAVCQVDQLAVTSSAAPGGAGWYYDDFSAAAAEACGEAAPATVGFTAAARPPAGVRTFLDCGP